MVIFCYSKQVFVPSPPHTFNYPIRLNSVKRGIYDNLNALSKQQLVSMFTCPQLKLCNSFLDERLKIFKIKLKKEFASGHNK